MKEYPTPNRRVFFFFADASLTAAKLVFVRGVSCLSRAEQLTVALYLLTLYEVFGWCLKVWNSVSHSLIGARNGCVPDVSGRNQKENSIPIGA